MTINIAGLTSAFKVPIAAREVNYGRGRRSVGSAQVRLLLVGNKTSAGSATADQDIVPIFTEEDADTYFGAGSELAIMCYHALAIPGVVVYGAPVAEATSSPAAGTATATIGGSWTTAGTASLWLAGKQFSVPVTTAMSTTQVAAALVAKVNSDTRLFCTAANVGAVITFTTRNLGVRANQWILRKDISAAPSGLTIAVAGGTALTGGMVPFTGGAGTDSVANVLALMTTDVWDIQAWAQNDSTNAGLVRTQLNSEAGALIMHTEHAVMAFTRGTSTSMSFASTTVNNQRMTIVHFTNCELHPAAIAAQIAAIRSTTVGDNPNARYNGVQCPTIPPQSQTGDIASISVNDALLNSGVMPLTTTQDGRVLIVRAIQSHCVTGSAPDFRTLDWGHADVPDRLSKELGADWELHSANNPYVRRDPAAGAEAPPEGVTTPSRWNAVVYARLKDFERKLWVQDVDANPPLTEFQTDRLMTATPCVVQLQNHIVGIQVNQQAAAP